MNILRVKEEYYMLDFFSGLTEPLIVPIFIDRIERTYDISIFEFHEYIEISYKGMKVDKESFDVKHILKSTDDLFVASFSNSIVIIAKSKYQIYKEFILWAYNWNRKYMEEAIPQKSTYIGNGINIFVKRLGKIITR